MTENSGSQTTTPSASGAPRSPGNEAVQASLKAVASARKAERHRRRRDRALVLITAGLTTLTAWGATKLFSGKPAASLRGGAVVANARVADHGPQPGEAPPLLAGELAAVAAAPGGELDTTDVLAVATKQNEDDGGGAKDSLEPSLAQCETAANANGWRQAVQTCEGVFDKAPDARSALTLAKVYYKRGHVQEAGFWAKKAVALDANLPEAFVIVAYAAERDGNTRNAALAYRHYLALAPRGWHAADARQGLQRLK